MFKLLLLSQLSDGGGLLPEEPRCERGRLPRVRVRRLEEVPWEGLVAARRLRVVLAVGVVRHGVEQGRVDAVLPEHAERLRFLKA